MSFEASSKILSYLLMEFIFTLSIQVEGHTATQHIIKTETGEIVVFQQQPQVPRS